MKRAGAVITALTCALFPAFRAGAAAPTAEPSPTELSPLEEMKERAQVLEPRLARIEKDADDVDPSFELYLGSCYDRYSGQRWRDHHPRPDPESGHEWLTTPTAEFAWQERWVLRRMYLEEADPMVDTCRGYWKEFATLAAGVDQALDDVDDDARRWGILPGHLAELIEKHHLQR